MSTRSLICRKQSRQVQCIYCHMDGYPEAAGAILQAHYDTPASRDALFALGDLSSLGDTPEDCSAYGRAFNERNTAARFACSVAGIPYEESGAEYVYLHMERKGWTAARVDWSLSFPETTPGISWYRPLDEVLSGDPHGPWDKSKPGFTGPSAFAW